MINKMKTRKGGYKRGVSNSAMYQLKLNPEGDAIDCSIERLDGESNQAYANRIEKIFESARVPNQQNLYQFNSLSLHPSEGDKFTDAQMIEMAKEVYLRNGVKNGLTENRHTMFVVERNTKHHHVHAMIHLTDLTTKKVNNKMIDYNPIIQKLELKYGLYNEHRKPKDEDEHKKTFKKELNNILDNALTASEFLLLADAAGFAISHSGQEAYSLTKDDQKFKASDLGMSYKTLKARLGDDPEFTATLASLHEKNPQNDDSGSITAPTNEAPATELPATTIPTNETPVSEALVNRAPAKKASAPQPAPQHQEDEEEEKSKRNYSNYGSQSSNDHKEKMADFYKGLKMQKTLYANYHHDDRGNYYFNKNDQKAFEFDASTGRVKFDRVTPSSARAGLQKLMEDKNTRDMYLSGGAKFKREMWLQFHLTNMQEKGYTLSGFRPSKSDLLELEKKQIEQHNFLNPKNESNTKSLPSVKPKVADAAVDDKKQLEKMKLENPAFKKPTEQNTNKALSTESGIGKNAADAADVIGRKSKKIGKRIVKAPAQALVKGVVNAIDVFSTHDAKGPMNEKLSEMRVNETLIKNSQASAENAAHQEERHRLQKLRPQ